MKNYLKSQQGFCIALILCLFVIALMPSVSFAQDELVTCKEGLIGRISFLSSDAAVTSLSDEAYSKLQATARIIKANPDCKVKIVGHSSRSKTAQQLSWDRVDAVVRFLTEKQGISEKRIIFTYGADGDANAVKINFTNEDGPNTVPAPYPYLRKKEGE